MRGSAWRLPTCALLGLLTDLPASALDAAALCTAPRLRRPFGTEMLRRLLLELAQRVEPSARRLRAYDLDRRADPSAAVVRLSGVGQLPDARPDVRPRWLGDDPLPRYVRPVRGTLPPPPADVGRP